MAYDFESGSSQYMHSGSTAPMSGMPVSMACFLQPESGGATRTMVGFGTSATTTGHYAVQHESGGFGRAGVWNGSAFNAAISAGQIAVGTMDHWAGTFASATARAVYKNGAQKATNAVSETPASSNRLQVGATYLGATIQEYIDGVVYYPLFCDDTLTDAEVLELAQFRHPRRFTGFAKLIALWTWQTNGALTDEISSVVLTAVASPTWQANVARLCTYTAINPTAMVAASSYNLEGIGLNDVQGVGKIELCDNAVYASATIKVTQTVTAWADDRATITAVRGGLSAGTVYAFLTNSNGNVSNGLAITLSGIDPTAAVVRRRRD